jgi:TRAP-type C4-dicarboxylate transport system substrate-binding protein
MRRRFERIALIVLALAVPLSAHALEMELLLGGTADLATRFLVDRFKSHQDLLDAGVVVTERIVPPAQLRSELKPDAFRIGLLSLDELISAGILKGDAVPVQAFTQVGQYPDTRDLFGLQRTALGEAALAEIGRSQEYVPIAYWNRGQTSILSRSPIRTAEDFQGRKIRSAFRQQADLPIVAMGAAPVHTPAAEVFAALQRGQFDAAEVTPALAIALVPGTETGNSLGTQFRPIVGFLVAAAAAWANLTEHQKAAIATAAKAADAAARTIVLDQEAQLEQAARARNLVAVNLAQADAPNFRRLASAPAAAVTAAQLQELQADRVAIGSITRAPVAALPRIARPSAAAKVPMLFVTDRNDEGGNRLQVRFGSNKVDDDNLKCGQVDYDAEPARTMGVTYAGPLRLQSPDLALGADNCVRYVSEVLSGTGRSRVLLFVHGFNNTFDAAIRRAITTAQDIGFDGIVLVWSWPAEGWVTYYMRDEEFAERTRRHFAPFAQALLQRPEIRRLDVLAHSMGARIVLFLLDELRKSGKRVPLGLLIFAAPDAGQGAFSDVVVDFVKKAPTLGGLKTLYAAKQDFPLRISSYIHGSDRAGQGGDALMILDGVESVDATEVEAGVLAALVRFAHAHVFDVPKAVEDLRRLLMEGKPAAERRLTRREREIGTVKKPYWIIPQ